MNLQQLYYFRTVAECEHFTRAADILAVTQPSLSHSIIDLETELGVHLFEKQGRNVKLTKYGKVFLEYVIQSLDILDEGKTKLNDLIHPNTGAVALGYFSSLEEFVPYLVTSFYKSTGQMQTLFQFQQLPSDMLEENLLSGAADIAFATHLNNAKLVCHKVGTHNLAVIVPTGHALAQKESIRLSELQDQSIITYDHQCRVRYYIDELISLAGIRLKILSETTHDALIYSYVAANYGIGLVPEPLSVKTNGIKVLRIEDNVPARDIYLIWKDVRYISPAVKKFRDYIISQGMVLDAYRGSINSY
jgi:DNA-binding transcriptional LysR family regulator